MEDTNKNSHNAECKNEENVCLMDEAIDAYLLFLAIERLSHFDPKSLLTEEEVNKRLGITENDLVGYEEVEIE